MLRQRPLQPGLDAAGVRRHGVVIRGQRGPVVLGLVRLAPLGGLCSQLMEVRRQCHPPPAEHTAGRSRILRRLRCLRLGLLRPPATPPLLFSPRFPFLLFALPGRERGSILRPGLVRRKNRHVVHVEATDVGVHGGAVFVVHVPGLAAPPRRYMFLLPCGSPWGSLAQHAGSGCGV